MVRGTLDALEEVVCSYQGRVLDRIGDEVMCAFSDARVAADASCALQEATTRLCAREGHAIAIRVGFHAGELVERDGRFFGDCIYVAKRLTDTAKGGQVAVAEETRRTVGPERYPFRLLDTQTLKGQSKPIRIFELLWNSEDATRVLGAPSDFLTEPPRVLVLEHAGRRFEVGEGQSISIGRFPPCDLVMAVAGVSRLHAKIEQRKGRFVLTDLSTNGTYVVATGRTISRYVRRDDMKLPESGLLGFGAEPAMLRPHTLPFLSRLQEQ